MDIKQFSQLDPKLKETYERVMGTGINPSTKPQGAASAPQRMSQPQTFVPKPFQPIQQMTQQQPFKPIQPQPGAQPIQRPQTQNLKKKNKIIPILAGLGGIIFIVGYTFFWIKIFKLKIPFLPF